MGGVTSLLISRREMVTSPHPPAIGSITVGKSAGSGNAAWRASRITTQLKPGRVNRDKCVATARWSGERCRNIAMIGVTVCYRHGGRGQQVAKRNREAKYAALEKQFRKSERGL